MIAQLFGTIFGATAVILGAFGAHALKKKFTPEQQDSFETGVRYQFYHALVLLFAGFAQSAGLIEPGAYVWLFISGTILFSFSIYGLCLSGAFGTKWRFLGPVTPLGGLLLVAGWVVLLVEMLEE
ncbi:DUF423 domain-containing protein [Parapedobacter sp. DT-150]|uniref:DUF423 domain-containing protein n=1 Tax=Parapedobacter sp. DT-150 TaxID=3396162 RepID=UPI003F1C3F3A